MSYMVPSLLDSLCKGTQHKMKSLTPSMLTIAGSDSGAGAGIQADLKAVFSIGVHCSTVLTTITAQNTVGVQRTHPLSAEIVEAQLSAIFNDMEIKVVKIGLLGSLDNINVIEYYLKHHRPKYIVVDPILSSTSGTAFQTSQTIKAMCEQILPLATIVTPNINEAKLLLKTLGKEATTAQSIDEMTTQAITLRKELGCEYILLKGGHLETTGDQCIDVLEGANGVKTFSHERIESNNTHGTGCNLSSAIGGFLSLDQDISEAVSNGIHFVEQAIRNGQSYQIGHGHGPLIPEMFSAFK